MSSNLNRIIFLISTITYINIKNIKDTWFENLKKLIELMWNYPIINIKENIYYNKFAFNPYLPSFF